MLYQAGTGNWMIRLSGSNYAVINTEDFGGPEYAPVSGDYDGDFRPFDEDSVSITGNQRFQPVAQQGRFAFVFHKIIFCGK